MAHCPMFPPLEMAPPMGPNEPMCPYTLLASNHPKGRSPYGRGEEEL